jgi:hypothetical protein
LEDSIEFMIEHSDPEIEEWFTADETGFNTGVFEEKLEVGDDFLPEIGEDIVIEYEDYTPVTTTPGMANFPSEKTHKITLSTLTTTGVLTLSSEPEGLVGPGYELKITLRDPDLNVDVDREDEVEVAVKSSTDTSGITVSLEETDINTGIFDEKIIMSLTTSLDDDSIEVSIGDDVQVRYLDDANDKGNDQSIIKSLKIVSEDPTMYFSDAYYLPGEVVKVTIEDLDANQDPDITDRIEVTVESTSDPIGVTASAVETDDDTGIFEISVAINDEIEPDEVFVAYGDILTATYTDEFPADYAEEEEDKDFTTTAWVGAVVEFAVPASAPEVVDSQGDPIVSPKVGMLHVFQSTIENIDIQSHNFAYILQIKKGGVVKHLAFITGSIEAGSTLTPGVSWIPTESGTYTAEIFVWESLALPAPLSLVQTMTFTVGG